jgi:hypothetical protein
MSTLGFCTSDSKERLRNVLFYNGSVKSKVQQMNLELPDTET